MGKKCYKIKVKNKKAMLKKPKRSFLGVGLGLCFTVFTASALISATIGTRFYDKYKDIAIENGYEKKNIEYRVEQVELLTEQYKDGKISKDELEVEIKFIPDLEEEEFMKNDPSVSEEAYEEYSENKRKTNIMIATEVGFMIGAGSAGLAPLTIIPKINEMKEERKKREIKNSRER